MLQSCPTFCNSKDCNPPASYAHGIVLERIRGGLPCPPPGNIPDLGVRNIPDPRLLCLLYWQAGSLPLAPPRKSLQLVVVQLLSLVQLFVTPWTAARQASLSFTITQSLLKLISIELVMPFNHLILCRLLLLLPSIFHSIRVFSDELSLCIRWLKYCNWLLRV